MTTTQQCVFRRNDKCEYWGGTCTPCRYPLSEIDGLSFRDHFDVYERRRMHREERRLKIAALLLSILAFCVSVGTLCWQIGSIRSKAPGPHSANHASEVAPRKLAEPPH
jgi:hypothetical protein